MNFFDPLSILAILVSLTVHEWSHAYVATRLGDPTPHNEGRLTLNPIAHIDPLGALLFLMAGFGWAKPVPVNPYYFKNQRMGILLVSAAGPLSNLILGFLSFGVLAVLSHGSTSSASVWELLSPTVSGSIGIVFLIKFLSALLFTNLGLMAFNLLPIAPLDGSKVLQSFIPLHLQEPYERYMQYGPYILLAILIGERFTNISIFSSWILWIMEGVLQVFALIFSPLG